MKKTLLVFIIISFSLALTGCGETLTGVSKDVSRMGKGVKTIFVRDSN
ncbi:MAG: hypothetical protein HQ579_02095 [Candidatus Omnitrophica bacterium]|nr:hypothetical protein [Candidatus Omnitrophota bacterium]